MATPDIYSAAALPRNVDPLLLRAIASVESGEKDDAIGKPTRYGTAKGRMQFIDETAARYGVTDPHDPKQSVPGAAAYMDDLLTQHGDPVKALLAYSGGDPAYPGKVAAAYQQLKLAQGGPAPMAKAAPKPLQDMTDAELTAHLTGGAALPSSGAKAIPDMNDEELAAHLTQDNSAAAAPVMTNADVLAKAGMAGQSVSAMDPNNPVGQSMPGVIANANLPGAGTQAKINLATDPEQRRRIAAKQLFPDLPPKEAEARIFYGDEGRLAAVGKDGQAFYVDPLPIDRHSGRSLAPGNLLATAGAALPGQAVSAAGIGGGLLAGPTSLVVGPAAAAASAGAADVGRQLLARQFDPATAPTPIDLMQTGKEAALSGGGQLIGAGIAGALAPNIFRVPPHDIAAIRDPAVLARAQAAYDRAGAQGVPISAGQATNLPSLLAREDVAHNALPATMDMTRQFYRTQGNALVDAGGSMLDRISPVADKTDASLMFGQGAADATTQARRLANAAARPSYEAAQAGGNVMSPDLAQLADQPAIKAAMDKARSVYQNLYRKAAPETPDFALWDLTKRALDDAHGIALRAGERTEAMATDSLRGDLLTHLDTAYPDYAKAREIAAPGQRLASRLEGSTVGNAATSAGDETARAVVAPVFNNANPRHISEARDAFAAANRSDEWNAGVRAYVQDAFDKASMSQQGLNPAMLRRQVWGNVDNREAIKAALTPQQYQGFDNFMSTVEDAARTYPMNSLTEPRRQTLEAMTAEASNTPGVKAVQAASAILSPFRAVNILGQVGDRLTGGMITRNMQAMTRELFSPNGMSYLRDMAAYSPGSQQAIAATAQFLSRLGATAAGVGGNVLVDQPQPAAAAR